VGIATPDSPRAVDLLRDATSALHHAKAKGGNRWEYLNSAVSHAARERLIMRSGIHEALAQDAIRPWYQPVFSLADGGFLGYEALARWVHNGRTILPDKFIPVAESTDLIVTLDRHIMRQAMADIVRTDRAAQVGINVSAQSLSEPDFADTVQDELDRSGYDPELLHLEVTETDLLRPTAHVQQAMRELRDIGVTWWVDDFGTGYSSITHLRDLPVQGLKLDGSFTAGLPDDGRAVRLAQALMGLARGLGMRTTAEGVETAAQAEVLAAQGWEWAQGWLYGKAAPLG
jgi:EAL domain-containing protein (putative c-di-GMP-specific phosphodiesterase class I)